MQLLGSIMGYDFSKKFIDTNAMDDYRSIDPDTTKRYGSKVKAMLISNREYQHCFDKLNSSRTMKHPPLSGRIFLGYLVVRNLGTKNEYETWIPDHVFEEIYERID